MESGQEGSKPKHVWVEEYFPPEEIEKIKKEASKDPENSITRRRNFVGETLGNFIIQNPDKPILNKRLSKLLNDFNGLYHPEKSQISRRVNPRNVSALDWLDEKFRLGFGILENPPKK